MIILCCVNSVRRSVRQRVLRFLVDCTAFLLSGPFLRVGSAGWGADQNAQGSAAVSSPRAVQSHWASHGAQEGDQPVA